MIDKKRCLRPRGGVETIPLDRNNAGRCGRFERGAGRPTEPRLLNNQGTTCGLTFEWTRWFGATLDDGLGPETRITRKNEGKKVPQIGIRTCETMKNFVLNIWPRSSTGTSALKLPSRWERPLRKYGLRLPSGSFSRRRPDLSSCKMKRYTKCPGDVTGLCRLLSNTI